LAYSGPNGASVKLPISHFPVWQVLPPLILWGD
jgi:hypothetical protein